jgi:hypothetical protein
MSDVEKKREVRETEPPTDTIRRIINIIFTLIGFLLLFRFVFLILGANPDNQFVDIIYSVTAPMVAIFTGIFEERDFGQGVLEPATLIALAVLFIISWALQSLFASRTVRREEYVEEDRREAPPREKVTRKETLRKKPDTGYAPRRNEEAEPRDEPQREEKVREEYIEEERTEEEPKR